MDTATSGAADIRTEGESPAGIPLVFYKGRNLSLLTINRFIQDLSSLLSHVVPTRTTQVATKRMPYLLIDREEIGRACVGLTGYGSEIVGRGATVTVSGGLLPIHTGEKDGWRGCALISVSIRKDGSFTTEARRMEMTDDLARMKRIVKKHNGSFRMWRRRGDAGFNMYLPVLYGPG
jgi:hypothetical protein